MACFLVSAAEATVVTVVEKHVEKKEKEREENGEVKATSAIQLSTKLKWLSTMLWGGALLLLFEHIWHGEVIPVFPFLTAVQNGETADMLAEMGTAGVGMAVLVTLIWGGMLVASSVIEKKKDPAASGKEART